MKKLERFEYWLTNIFWYHYKWYWFFGVFAASFFIMLVADNIRSVTYDWKVAYYTADAANAAEGASALAEQFSKLLPDRTGDKAVNVDVVVVNAYPGKSGQEPLFQAVGDGEAYIIAAPESFLKYMRSLGYLVRLGDDGSYWKSVVWGGNEYILAVNDGIIEFSREEQAFAIGMSREQIADYDAQLLKQHSEKLEIAVETVGALG